MEEHQNCPICFEIPSQEIYQCVGGHTICHICVSTLRACPQCRELYGTKKIRNRVLEEILDEKTFDCVNADEGCKEKLKRQDISKHAKSCLKRAIYLCKLLGYQHCNYVLEKNNRSGIIKHLTEEHGIVGERTTEVCVWHVDLKSTLEAPSFTNLKWNSTLLIVDTNWGKDSLFVITGFVDFIRECVSWTCLQIFGGDSGSTFEAEFSLFNTVTKTSPIKWTIPVVNIQTRTHDQEYLIKSSPIQTPFWFLKQVCGGMKNIPISAKVQPSAELDKNSLLRKYISVRTHTSTIL